MTWTTTDGKEHLMTLAGEYWWRNIGDFYWKKANY